MKTKPLAFAVHLFTGTGAAFALLAVIAAGRSDWRQMFLWLGIALLVDGLDGPLARMVDIKRNAANWDGDLLDLVIDYLTYVFIPAYALIYSGLLSPGLGMAAAIGITLSGVVYFADVRMKAADNSFVGFPSVFQMPLLVLMTFNPAQWVTLVTVTVLALAQFTNLKFIHPVRTERLRALNLTIMGLWVVFGAWSVWANFDPPSWVQMGLLASSLYLLLIGIVFQVFPRRDA